MKEVIVIFAILSLGSAATFEYGLRARFAYSLKVGKTFFIDLPRTLASAIEMGWLRYDRPTSYLSSLEMYCGDLSLCCMYDSETNFTAGVQVAILLSEFTNATYDWTIQGFIPWTVTNVNGTECSYMTKQVYFINEDTLAKSTEERLLAAETGNVIQEDMIWPLGFNQELTEVSINATKNVESYGYTKQNCIPWMGTHYFYNMTESLECAADTFSNWFLLADGEDLIGIGLVLAGIMPQTNEETYYFERPSKSAVQLILKTCPDCVAELAESPTLTTMHLYLINNPWNVGCYSL